MLEIKNLSVKAGNFRIENLSLKVEKGEYLVLLGPSGSGKSTLLETIAGFRTPERGRVIADGEDITHLPPERRGVAIVYQDYLLFPHLSVYENLAFGLRKKVKSRSAERIEVERIARELRITHLLDKPARLLSGGEKQRVAIGRAILSRPRLLLLDEPLSALDAHLRPQLRRLLKKLTKERKITTLHVSHDFADAESLADGVALMLGGRIVERGTFEEVFFEPSTLEGAKFLGVNALGVREILKTATGIEVLLTCGAKLRLKTAAAEGKNPAHLLFRPEAVRVSPEGFEVEVIDRGRENFWETLGVRSGNCTFRVKLPYGTAPADRLKIEITRAVLKRLR